MTNSKRGQRPDDLKGKMRTMENPVHVTAYKGLGIVTTPMAFPEVFTACRGTVDGQENPLSVIMDRPSSTRCKAPVADRATCTRPAIFVMNKASFDKLSAADKHGPSSTPPKAQAQANRFAPVDEDDAKGRPSSQQGMNVVENVDKAKFVATLPQMNAEFEKQFGKANIDKIRNYK